MSGLLLFFIVLYAAVLTVPVIYAWEHRRAIAQSFARLTRRRFP